MPRFGVTTFPTDYGISIVELARAVEERGLDSLFFHEHSHIPVSRETPFPAGGDLPREYSHAYDPFVSLSAAAMVTTKIFLGTGICLVAQRDPIHLAKQVASLDQISNGRVILGIGAGWNVEEMRNHGTLFKHRWKIMREHVLAMREIWTKDVAEFHGQFVDFDPIWSWPKPVQKGGPKILLGSKSERSFKRIVEYCDGWAPIGGRGGEALLDEGIKELRAVCQSAGKSFASLELAAIEIAPDENYADRLLKRGFEHLIFHLPSVEADLIRPMLDKFAMIARRFR